MEGFTDALTLDLVRSSIRLATPILLAALAAALSNRAGVLNFALEGKMLLGAFLGILSTYWFGNTYVGVLCAMLAGAALGALFAFVYLRYQVDLVILAIALNLFVAEMTVYFLRTMIGDVGSWSDPSIKQLPDIPLPLVKELPIIGPLVSGYNLIVYTSWLATLALYVLLFHTKFGRHVRAVGENQDAAETVGINVPRVKFFALILGGSLAALGGAFLSVGHLTLFTRAMSNGRGFLGLTAALFGFNHPLGALLASFLFGGADALAVRLQNVTNIPPSLIQFLPNLLAILALVLVALRIRGLETWARRRFRVQAQQLAGK
jgi:simple sugar transport system permease protein